MIRKQSPVAAVKEDVYSIQVLKNNIIYTEGNNKLEIEVENSPKLIGVYAESITNWHNNKIKISEKKKTEILLNLKEALSYLGCEFEFI